MSWHWTSLHEWLAARQSPLGAAEVAALMFDIVKAVEHLHAQKLVHRAISVRERETFSALPACR